MTDTRAPASDRWIGAPVRRLEDPRLLTGAGRFVDDIDPPGVLHAAFVRSPFAAADGDNRRVARFIDLQAIVTGSKKIEGEVWRIHFERLVLIEVAQVNADDAFAETDLCDVIGQVQKGESGFTGQTNRRRPSVQFGSGTPVCPELITRANWPVHHR